MRVVAEERVGVAGAEVDSNMPGVCISPVAVEGIDVVRAAGNELTGTVFSAARRASADWKRLSGSFAMHMRMIWLSAAGRSLRRVMGGGGSELSCALIKAYCESVSNGTLPVSIS